MLFALPSQRNFLNKFWGKEFLIFNRNDKASELTHRGHCRAQRCWPGNPKLMKHFSPDGATPDLSSPPACVGPRAHSQAGENPESLCPGLPMTTGNCSQGRQPPGQAVFALSQSVQLSFLPAGVFFLCQL